MLQVSEHHMVGRWLLIKNVPKEYEGALHFATDAWTSPNHRAFVAVTVHFEEQGKPVSFLLDVVEVACSHTGVNLAAAFAKILKEFGIEHKVSPKIPPRKRGETHFKYACKIKAVTCDNTSNNDTMVEALVGEDNLPDFEGQAARVRCFLHILNIVGSKNLVNLFDTRAQKKKDSGQEGDDEEIAELAGDPDEIVEDAGNELDEGHDEADAEDEDNGDGADEGEYDPEFFDGEEEVDAMAELNDKEQADFMEAIRPVKLILAKVSTIRSREKKSAYEYGLQIRTFASKVVNSSTILLPAWKECVASHDLPERLIPHDVRTRWNSTYDMLEMVLEYRVPYQTMCERTDNGLRGYELSKDEWQVATQLEKVLKVRAPLRTLL